ncbi:MAG TPA: thioesterase family protein [Solirubrobacterales bacterium]|nr:thioesterase family protein [Solirubrobacterales bacterium]
MAESFYEQEGDLYAATELTRGPWDPAAQHAGPPAALIGREIERLGEGRMGDGEGAPAQVGRITYEILRSVPIARLRVEAEAVRPGRRVELVRAILSDEEGEPLVRAQGWRLRTEQVSFDDPPGDDEEPLPGPDRAAPGSFPDIGYEVGYHSAMEYRFVRGSFTELGPATVWMRMGVPLVPGEEPTPLQRVLVAADSGNGVSVTLDWSRYLFINVDLSVHLHRLPAGEWVCLDAATYPETNGLGMADTRLLDERGPIGRAAQTLLVAERSYSFEGASGA